MVHFLNYMNTYYLQIPNLIQMKYKSKGNLVAIYLGNFRHLESTSFMIFFISALAPFFWIYYPLQTQDKLATSLSFSGFHLQVPRQWGMCSVLGHSWESHLTTAIEWKNHPNYFPNYKTTVLGGGEDTICSSPLIDWLIHWFTY